MSCWFFICILFLFFVKNFILHANSYKDPSRYQVQWHVFGGFFAVKKGCHKIPFHVVSGGNRNTLHTSNNS